MRIICRAPTLKDSAHAWPSKVRYRLPASPPATSTTSTCTARRRRGNDASESLAINAVFRGTPCSSTKGATGHTLGAAGAIEAVISALALRHQFMPAGVGTSRPDPALNVNYVLESRSARLKAVLTNSFGFGGTNCSLIFGRADLVHERSAGR